MAVVYMYRLMQLMSQGREMAVNREMLLVTYLSAICKYVIEKAQFTSVIIIP